jgi:hypothetical protein
VATIEVAAARRRGDGVKEEECDMVLEFRRKEEGRQCGLLRGRGGSGGDRGCSRGATTGGRGTSEGGEGEEGEGLGRMLGGRTGEENKGASGLDQMRLDAWAARGSA